MYNFTRTELHDAITDRICELENFIEGFSHEELQDNGNLLDVANAKIAIDQLETARYICDEYLY